MYLEINKSNIDDYLPNDFMENVVESLNVEVRKHIKPTDTNMAGANVSTIKGNLYLFLEYNIIPTYEKSKLIRMKTELFNIVVFDEMPDFVLDIINNYRTQPDVVKYGEQFKK